MKKVFAFVLFAAGLASCQNNSDELLIEGTVTGGDKFIVYENKPEKFTAIDTIVLEDGSFKIGLALDTPGFYWFVFEEKNASIPLYFNPKEKIELDINIESRYPEYTISGSPDSDKLKRQWESFYKTYSLSDSLDTYVQSITGEGAELPNELKTQLNELYKIGRAHV